MIVHGRVKTTARKRTTRATTEKKRKEQSVLDKMSNSIFAHTREAVRVKVKVMYCFAMFVEN